MIELPPDFEQFWRRTVTEALAFPLEFERAKVPSLARSGGEGIGGEVENPKGGSRQSEERREAVRQTERLPTNPKEWSSAHDVFTYAFEGFLSPTPNPLPQRQSTLRDGAQRLHGWLAIPKTGSPPFPAFIWIPPYGRESVLPNRYGTRDGFVSISLNFFGHHAFHQEKYRPERGYFAQGVLSPETWVMRQIFQNAVLAARILREQPEVDPDRIGAMGMSQGAGIAIWLGAWVDWIGAVCADMPFLGGMSQVLGQHVYRYPLKELTDFAATVPDGLEKIKHTLSYFDTLNVARRCSKPTHVSLGEKDPAVRPASAEAIFNALPGRKVLRRYPGGHDWYPPMIENNREWLLENLS